MLIVPQYLQDIKTSLGEGFIDMLVLKVKEVLLTIVLISNLEILI
jgi:hypothetical protein